MSRVTHILAVDGGGTKTEAALFSRAGEELARARTGACNLYQDPAGGIEAVAGAWKACCAVVGLDPSHSAAATCISAGLAGVNATGAAARFHRAFGGFAERRLSSDGYTALLGAFEAAPGALLSIGTGVVAYRLHGDGSFRMLSGWGFPTGDRGGGAWLGFRLVGDWLERRDGYGPLPAGHPLQDVVEGLVGARRDAILGWLKSALPGELARLARPVVEAAEAGDAYARSLLDAAARHHLELVEALAPSEGEPLVLGGGLAPVFLSRIETALGPTRIARDRTPSPLRGAWLVGVGQAAPEFTET
jgi:glucosamine kinase